MKLIKVKLKNKEYFNDWLMYPNGTAYIKDGYIVPYEFIVQEKEIELINLSQQGKSVMLAGCTSAPFDALMEESQTLLYDLRPEIFI